MKIKANNETKSKARFRGILLSIGVLILICIVLLLSSYESRKTITVMRVKENTSISPGALITESMIEPYDMYYKEFKNYGTIKTSTGETKSALVKWISKDKVVGNYYATYYMRGGTVMFKDGLTNTQEKKNSYLYNMKGELLNIHMNTVNDFGDMVVPGDRLNIRATYKASVYNLPTEEEYNLSLAGGSNGGNGGVQVTQTEPLFSEVTILDMLNSNGNSIFDIYYKYASLPTARQKELLKDQSFLDSVKPASILVEATAEEVEHYHHLQEMGATYLITLVPRTNATNLTDSLAEIQTALSSVKDNN